MTGEKKQGKPRGKAREKVQEECVFCRIVQGKIPSAKILETGSVLAFLDIAPINKGHSLVIPKAHYSGIHDIPEKEFREVAAAVKRVASAVKRATAAEGINVLQANGKAAGQEVMHFHAHVIPRFSGDNSGFKWQKRPYAEGEMQALQGKIRVELK